MKLGRSSVFCLSRRGANLEGWAVGMGGFEHEQSRAEQ
jgi:hypothetical protein